MKKRFVNSILSVFLVLLLVSAMVPQLGSVAYAQEPGEKYLGPAYLGRDVNTPSARVVKIGGKYWYVIGYNGTGVASEKGEVVLLMDESLGSAPYDSKNLKYKGSKLQNTIDNYINESFTAAEKGAIIPRQLKAMNVDSHNDDWWWDNCQNVDEVPYEGVTALAWPLSAKEACAVNKNLRNIHQQYWLRSLGTVPTWDWDYDYYRTDYLMSIVWEDGDVDIQDWAENISYWKGVRPALKLKMEDIVFTTSDNPRSSRLTLKDDAHKNFSVEDCFNSINKDGELVVHYENAVPGSDEYISYIIENNGEIKKYQRCGRVESASGSVTLGKLSLQSGDKLYVFNEQDNGNKTDYSSELIEISTKPGHEWAFWYFDGGVEKANAYYYCKKNNKHVEHKNATVTYVPPVRKCDEYVSVDFTVSISAEDSLDGATHQMSGQSVLKPLGHDWGETEYTWSDDNKKVTARRVCGRDGTHIETETVGTTMEVTQAPTCTSTGLATYKSNPFANKAFAVQTKTGVELPVDSEAHDWDNGVVIEAQNVCGGRGKKYTCSRCNTTKIESLGGHKWEEEKSVLIAPTCEENGEKSYKCSMCEAFNLDELELINPLGHDWVNGTITITKNATCTEDGVKTYTCFHDSTHIKTEVIPKTGHTPNDAVRENEVKPTCENAGSYDEVVYCQTCGAEISREKKTVKALGHNWGAWTQTKAATCTRDGAEERVCSNDGNHKQTRVIEALGHDWGDWVVTKEATETEEGSETRSCKRVTGHTETRSIPKKRSERDVIYRNTAGDGTQWTKGSTATAVFTFNRTIDDGSTFSHFTGIKVDGRDVAESDYTAEPGSVIVELKPAYLETLAAGEHTITALFDDGNNASAKFTIADKNSGGGGSGKDGKGSPGTGDDNTMGVWMAILLTALSGTAVMTYARKRRKN